MAELAYGKQLDLIRDQLVLWNDQWHFYQVNDEQALSSMRTTMQDIAAQVQRLEHNLQFHIDQEEEEDTSKIAEYGYTISCYE